MQGCVTRPPGEALRGRPYGRFRLDAPAAGFWRAVFGGRAYAWLTAGSKGHSARPRKRDRYFRGVRVVLWEGASLEVE